MNTFNMYLVGPIPIYANGVLTLASHDFGAHAMVSLIPDD